MNGFLEKFCSIGISFTVDGFRILYFGVMTLSFVLCSLFGIEYFKGEHKNKRFVTFWVITFLSVCGLLFSADYFTFFMFFEIMSFASAMWVFHNENKESDDAGRVYLRISVICGMVTLYGIMLIYHTFNTLNFERLVELSKNATNNERLIPAILLLVGFGAKAGLFPVHCWLPKAHPAAPAPSSAILSGILTKTGVFGVMLTVFSLNMVDIKAFGNILLVLSGFTMFIGAFLGVFSTNIKRTLACSSVSQIGFIFTGLAALSLTGEGFAFTGTLCHMLNHTFIKVILFQLAGAVFVKVRSLELNDIKGFGKGKPGLMLSFLIAGLSLSGLPGTTGYVSKTLLHEAVEKLASNNSCAEVISILFTITGGLTFCYMSKLFVCLFVENGKASSKENVSIISQLCIIIPAVCVFVFGFYPKDFSALPSGALIRENILALGRPDFSEVNEIKWLSFGTMKGCLLSIFIGIIFYLVIVRRFLTRRENGERVYVDGLPEWVDMERYFYRPVIMYFLTFVLAFFSRVLDKITEIITHFLRSTFFAPLKKKRKLSVGDFFTYGLGSILDRITKRNKNDEKTSYVSSLALVKEETGAIVRMLERSLSLSLILFSIGLIVTIIYMLVIS